MTRHGPTLPMIGPAIPNLFVRDLPIALTYYAAIGFRTLFRYGDPPFYAQVARDRCTLALRHTDRPALDHAVGVDLLGAYAEVSGVDALFVAMQSAGALIHQPPRDEAWGLRSFIVRDPDGNLLCFAGPPDRPDPKEDAP